MTKLPSRVPAALDERLAGSPAAAPDITLADLGYSPSQAKSLLQVFSATGGQARPITFAPGASRDDVTTTTFPPNEEAKSEVRSVMYPRDFMLTAGEIEAITRGTPPRTPAPAPEERRED